jgi:Leucine-rich repeat (LRR) protein
VLDGMSCLLELNLAENALSSLPPTLLASCRLLQKINISHNHVVALPAGMLEALPRLRSVDLSYNLLAQVPGLELLEEAQSINVSYNVLTSLPVEPLQKLRDLAFFDATGQNTYKYAGPLTIDDIRPPVPGATAQI